MGAFAFVAKRRVGDQQFESSSSGQILRKKTNATKAFTGYPGMLCAIKRPLGVSTIQGSSASLGLVSLSKCSNYA